MSIRYGLDGPDRTGKAPVFPAQSSVLDEEALLERVVSQYAIPPARSCELFSQRDADTYRIETDGPPYYLKVYRPPHKREHAEAEATLVDDLYSRCIRVARPIRRHDGAFASDVNAPEGVRPVLVSARAAAHRLKLLGAEDGEQMGAAVALMHAAADVTERSYALPTFDAEWVLLNLFPYTQRLCYRADCRELQALLEWLCERLQGVPRTSPEFGVCHRDLVCSNIRRDDDGDFVFFDFGNAAYSWRGYGLAVLYLSLSRHVAEGQLDEVWEALVGGYRDVRELPASFEAEAGVFNLLRRVDWVCRVIATCPLRTGTQVFRHHWVNKQMPALRELARACGMPQ